MLSLNDARFLISDKLKAGQPIVLPTREATSHALATDVFVQEDFPAFSNSAMDGYAVRKSDLKNLPISLPVSMELAAGSSEDRLLKIGNAARIFTGANIPEGADCVIKQEDAELSDDETWVRFPNNIEFGDFIRFRGEDLRRGDCLLEAGTKLGPAQIACLISQGIYEVSVVCKPSVGYVMTGDELRFEGESVENGQIRSCNGELFDSFLSPFSSGLNDYGYVSDNLEELKKKLLHAKEHDLFLISGGASVGKYDHTRKVLESLGYTIHFERVAVRPGKPLIFATRDNQAVFGVPGTPVSSFVACMLFISHALAVLGGWKRSSSRVLSTLTKDHTKSSKFDMYLRGILSLEGNRAEVDTNLNQSSGALGSLARANCLVILPAGKSVYKKGETVEVIPIAGWGTWN